MPMFRRGQAGGINHQPLEREYIMSYVYTMENTNSIARALSNDEYASWHKNYTACLALAEYIESAADGIGEPIELDIVAIRCDYSLMDDIADYNKQYDHDCRDIEEVREFTTVIDVDGTAFIIADY